MGKLQVRQTEWNLTSLFSSDEDPGMEVERKLIEENSYKFINKWKDREDYLKEPRILKEALDEYEKWARDYSTNGNQGYYLYLRQKQELGNPELKGKLNKLTDFALKIHNDIQFFTLKVAKIPQKEQNKFLESEELKEYKHFLERLFAESKYVLSETEEKILALTSKVSHENWTQMVSQFLAREERKVKNEKGKGTLKNFQEIASLINDKNKSVRDSAVQAFNSILSKFVDVAEAEMNSIIENKKIRDEIRKIERPDLSRHLHDDIESEVVDTLLETVSSRFDISKRYYALKAKLLNLPYLEYHERNVEYGEITKEYSYKDSVELVHEVFHNLDQEFANIFKDFVENGFIDIYPRKGKSGGAFCTINLSSQPIYILLNHTNKLHDVLILAHESGHGINHQLMKKQNALNYSLGMATAEVASTFTEDFVLQEILEDANDEQRLAIQMQKLNDDVSSIFRQVAAYKFEKELHAAFKEKGFVPKEEIGTIFQNHMKSYMGNSVEQSEGAQNWWIYWSHFRSFFYVYSYASGLLISKSMQNSIRKDKKFIGKVKEFLSAGSSDSPKNIFRKMGIDITDKNFWYSGLNEVEILLTETESLAKRLGKI